MLYDLTHVCGVTEAFSIQVDQGARVLMWFGMGLLMPVAIVLVRFSKQARERGDLKTVRMLVYMHIFVQVIEVVVFL